VFTTGHHRKIAVRKIVIVKPECKVALILILSRIIGKWYIENAKVNNIKPSSGFVKNRNTTSITFISNAFLQTQFGIPIISNGAITSRRTAICVI